MITPEECASLFNKYSVKPVSGIYICEHLGNMCACAIGIIAIDKFKTKEDSRKNIYNFNLGFNESFHYGIVDGFDDKGKSSYMFGEDYLNGYIFGKRVRELVNPEPF